MPSDPVDIDRLCLAMHRARLALRRPREERLQMVRQFAGNHWSDEGTKQPVPINLISLYIGIVARNLIAKNPRCLLSTFKQQHKPVVAAMGSWVNKQIEHINLASTLERVVVDALFSIGICKVALATPADAASFGWALRGGEPYAERVDLDDFVFDLHARDFSEVTFIGHRFRAPLRVIKQSRIYDRQRLSLSESEDASFNLEGDERISMLGRSYMLGQEEFEDHVDLWEVYLPRHRVVLTLADDHLTGPSVGRGARALRAQRWLGPECGPYHLLCMGVVPGNAMPKGPVQDLYDLHMLANNLYRKLGRQGEREKEVGFVTGAASEDGGRVIKANDGEFVKVDNAAGINLLEMGGPSQKNFGLFTSAKDLFTYLAGNLDMMGGLSPQSKTLGQDQLLAQNASHAVADMQDRTVSFATSVIKALCWYWHHDPQKVMRTTHSLPGLPDMQFERAVHPASHPDPRALRRTMPFEELELKVDPYSMQHQTPQGRMQALMQVVQQIVMPILPILQQQGIGVDFNKLLEKISALMDMPDLAEVLTIVQPPQQDAQRAGQPPGMPQNTQRSYVRENRSAPTRQGSDLNSIQTLMSGKEVGGKNGTAGAA